MGKRTGDSGSLASAVRNLQCPVSMKKRPRSDQRPEASYRFPIPPLGSVTTVVEGAVEGVGSGILTTNSMRSRRQGPAAELTTKAVDRVSDIHQTVIIHVTRVGTGERSSDEEHVQVVNNIGDVECTVDVAVTTIEATGSNRWQDHATVDGFGSVSSTIHNHQVVYRAGTDGTFPVQSAGDWSRGTRKISGIGIVVDDNHLGVHCKGNRL